MKIEVHILAFNESEILGYALRHYRTYATRIVVHDSGSTDGTHEICGLYGAELEGWDTGGCLDDMAALTLKNNCWKGTDADWVVCADADEFLYFPQGHRHTLLVYGCNNAAMIKPYGFEMFAEKYPTTDGQIYDEVKHGARDDHWYGKPVLFNPHMVEESGFGVGAHEADPMLRNGRRLHVGKDWPKPNPPAYLLHYHQIGPADRLARRYDEIQARFSRQNRLRGWGVSTPGATHVQEKRDYIVPRLEQVIT